MKRFIEPDSVAVIGASGNPGKGGYALVENLKEKFMERLYPVNPQYEEICGLPCYKTVGDMPEKVDLVIIFVPASTVPEIMEECGQNGLQRVMIQSAGFAETGDQGLKLQEQCVNIARKYGIRLWGPNCMGVVNGQSGMVASFMRHDMFKDKLRPGNVSLIVQSGMLSAGFLMQILSEGYFGISKTCSIGNRGDINECDLLEYFTHDPETEVVAMYIESISDVPRFREAISRLNRPVVLLKGGISADGARAARSHTASMAGDARISEGLFRQLGIIRAWDFLEWMDLTRALVLWKGKKGGKRMAVVTFSGASGIVASDHFAMHGMKLATLSRKTLETLKTIFPAWMKPRNPVDIWPAIELNGEDAYRVTLETLLQDPNVDGIYLHLYVHAQIFDNDLDFLRPLEGSEKPAAIWPIGDMRFYRTLHDHAGSMGIPVYKEIKRGVQALGIMKRDPHRPLTSI
ncbi:MAG: CoA-binding protein [Deltaproteobacteria bacterium]|nr:CoA-binding protein [Deltaproteobacteria bacterium]